MQTKIYSAHNKFGIIQKKAKQKPPVISFIHMPSHLCNILFLPVNSYAHLSNQC